MTNNEWTKTKLKTFQGKLKQKDEKEKKEEEEEKEEAEKEELHIIT